MQSTNFDESNALLRNRRRFRAYLAAGGLLVISAISVAVILRRPVDSRHQSLQHARAAFESGDYQTALEVAARVLKRQSDNGEAAMLAGRAAVHLNENEDAVRYFDRVPPHPESEYIAAQNAAGDVLLLRLHRLSQAAKRYRAALAVDKNDSTANDRLGFLLGLASRGSEQVPHRLRLIRLEKIQPVHLLSLALGSSVIENSELVREYHRTNPDDPFLLLSLARIATEEQRYEQARQLLREAVRRNPNFVSGQVRLGAILFDHATREEFLQWHTALPEAAETRAETWALRGRWLLKQSRTREATRCFAEALRRDPNHERANYQVGRLLSTFGKREEAAPFLKRSRLLRKYVNVVKVAFAANDEAALREAAQLAESLALYWEAYGWAFVAKSFSRSAPTQKWARKMTDRLKPMLDRLPLVRTRPEDSPVLRLALDEFPLPSFRDESPEPTRKATPPKIAAVTFEDRASSAGLRFRYFNGRESVESGMKYMYEFAGGGVAVLDYDGDDRPDIHLTQGSRWPNDSEQTEHLDRLFRNRGDGKYVDVTAATRLLESGFSQGAAVGDYNSDGFPDLFIANIGRNRLYRNNGDGTFAEVALPAAPNTDQWSTSALLADVNSDGHPDLYVVNYVTAPDVFTRVCRSGDRAGICLPQSFPAEQDRLYLNGGDETFRDVTETSGIKQADGKGLGIIAADFEGSGRVNLFVANDTTPNYLFVPRAASSHDPRIFSEVAMRSGTALNRSGRTESCMGIAVGDADGDGRLDLFVTNFIAESNTLYRQISPRNFDDVTRTAALREASLPLVGFGTQFLDANLDGWLDLIVTNGHIDDFRSTQSVGYKMPPQFFANGGKGRFQLVAAKSLGPYFQQKYLGRSLARLDWNRDGREDVIILHLDAPVALLTNTTREAGRFVALRLRGTRSNRDAIGATVRVKTANATMTRQLTAGDGYQASNERSLIIGLGTANRVESLSVSWPSGKQEEFSAIRANSRWILVEGSGRMLAAPALSLPDDE